MIVRYPPRSVGCLHPKFLSKEEKKGKWVAQLKFNGQHTLIYVSKKGNIRFYNRHGVAHKNFQASRDLLKEILSLNLERGKEYWLDGELLWSKPGNRAYKGVVVLFDVLQCSHKGRDEYLFGVNQEIRLDLLKNICNNPYQLDSTGIGLKATPNIWMAEVFHNNFYQHYKKHIHLPVIEGLMLRELKSELDNNGFREYEVPWLLRVRKESKSYTH